MLIKVNGKSLGKIFLKQVFGKELLPEHIKNLNELIIIKEKNKFKIGQKTKTGTL